MTTGLTRYLAPSLLAVSAVLAAANWYLQPERITSWTAALVTLAVMGVILWITLHPAARGSGQRAVDSIRDAVTVSSLILGVSLSVKLAQALGALDDSAVAQRLTMAILGAFFAFTGNAIPKTLTPLSVMRCDGARTQALQRFAGRALVLSGIGFAAVWLVLPIDIATPVSVVFIVAAGLAVMAQAIWLRRIPRSG